MKKLDSKQRKETPEEENKRLRKRIKQLEANEVKNKNTIKGLRKELKKKRRSDSNYDRRTKSITLEPVPGHRFPLVVIQLCVLIYLRTNCGLRTVVKILEIFAEVLGEGFGKIPCYNTVENWMKKLGLSVYQDDQPCKGKKFAMVIDESIAINGQKLLLALAIPSEHQDRPVKHEDVTVLNMTVGANFKGEDIKNKIDEATNSAGSEAEYVVSDNAHNLVRGILDSGNVHHADISHSMGVILKHTYEKQADFVELTTLLGKIRLQYHLTNKAYLLPPNMRTIARFMNMSEWVKWGNSMLACFDKLPKEMQEAFAFINDYKSLFQELMAALDAIRHIEHICKNYGFSIKTSKECQSYIITHVIGNAYPRQANLGLKMLEYFRKEEALLNEDRNICISSDIIESTFGIYKSKKSPNKLYGITPFALMIPLYPKIVNESVTKTFNFKERLVNVKLKDIDAWATKHLSKNWVTERTKTLKLVS